MTCAKLRVKCTLVTLTGHCFIGTNDCKNPQPTCPRLPGEGYEKCVTICKQPGHAETVALQRAFDAGVCVIGATAYMEGHRHFCFDCQHKLFDAGVKYLVRGMPK